MDFDDREDDKKQEILTDNRQLVSLDRIKNIYICEGVSAKELADKFFLPVTIVEKLIADNKLDQLRAAHVKHGLEKLSNIQVAQAEKLLNIENQFKRMRIIQLEKMLEDFMAYYSRHGHFYKIHPISGEILRDTNNLPIQIKLPNVASEITQLKESVSLSEGLKVLLNQIDAVINKPKDVESLDPNTIDMSNMGNLFKKKSDSEDDE